MKLDNLSKEELEQYSHEELAKLILEQEGSPINTPSIFKKICSLLDMSDSEYADKIGDFYTSLTTDKDFVLLEDGRWDLRDHHPAPTIIEEDDDIYEEENTEDFDEIIDLEVVEEDDETNIDDDLEDDFTIIDEDDDIELED